MNFDGELENRKNLVEEILERYLPKAEGEQRMVLDATLFSD